MEDGAGDGPCVTHAHSRSRLHATPPPRSHHHCGRASAPSPITTLSRRAFFVGSGIGELEEAFFFKSHFSQHILLNSKRGEAQYCPRAAH